MDEDAEKRPMCGMRRIERNDDVAGTLGQRHTAGFRMREPPTYQKGMTVKTEYLPHSTVVWVTVAGVQNPRIRWTYTLTEAKPGSPKDGTIVEHPLSSDKLGHSYAELLIWLYTYGCAPPSPDYFTPTREEIDEGAEWIVRPVTRPRPDTSQVRCP